MSYLLALLAISFVVSAVGWAYFIYFFSIGYGLSISALAVATVVMFSDGVAEGSSKDYEDSLWLADMLTFSMEEEESIWGMSQKILRAAKQRRAGGDDMTVIVLRVEAA